MSKLKSYQDVLEQLDEEIKTKRAYNEKLANLELELESNNQVLDIFKDIVGSLFGVFVGIYITLFNFDSLTINQNNFIIFLLIGLMLLVEIYGIYKQNKKRKKLIYELLILKQEYDTLYTKKPDAQN